MDIADYFQPEFVGRSLADLETPVPVIDLDVVERNVRRWQARCDAAGFANRPHIKTHKLVGLARYQLDHGARGITVQKLGEAEIMADAGLTDQLLTYNVVGAHKLGRLAAVARRTAISVVADNAVVVEGLGAAALSAGRAIDVLVECDTGAHRNGVQSPEDAATLARTIAATPGLRYGGLMTYARTGGRLEAEDFLVAARHLAAKSGLETKVVTSGGTPDMWKDEGLAAITEYRVGTYIYVDRSLVEGGIFTYDDCALTVLATVVSRPTSERALIDAGSKALTSDLSGLSGFGVVRSLNGARIYALSEEHGFLDISGVDAKPSVGDLVRITPNHVCPVSNLYDKVVLLRGGEVLGAVKVDCRGTVQ